MVISHQDGHQYCQNGYKDSQDHNHGHKNGVDIHPPGLLQSSLLTCQDRSSQETLSKDI